MTPQRPPAVSVSFARARLRSARLHHDLLRRRGVAPSNLSEHAAWTWGRAAGLRWDVP